MGRAWRIEYEGALYHLMSRGNDGQDIYLDDTDPVIPTSPASPGRTETRDLKYKTNDQIEGLSRA